jgi:hypothetical protein
MNKTKLNYWVDLIIGVSFVFSAISGLVFLLPVSPDGVNTTILGISYSFWNDLHTWSSLLMITGTFLHLVLHWKWIVCMTRKQFQFRTANTRLVTSPSASPLSRRRFLYFGGLTLMAGTALAGYKAITELSSAVADSENNENSPQLSAQDGCVACPMGLVKDPYPGRCRLYLDNDGDGLCDYSIPSSCDNADLSQTSSIGPDRFNPDGRGFRRGFRGFH